MSQAIARQEKSQLAEVAPFEGRNRLARVSLRELKELAEICMASGQFTDIKSVAQAQLKILAGNELGFSPIVSMTGIHFFNGKVSLGANLIASLIKNNGKYEYKITEHTAEACSIVFYQLVNGELKQLGVPVRYTFADAQKAGLTSKDNWKKYPMDMLFAACIRQGARRYCADILRGVTPDTDTESDNEVDRSAMDGEPVAVAETTTIDGEIVDTETGEVVGEAEDERHETGDKSGADYLAQINDLLKIKCGDGEMIDEDAASAFLKGRDLSQMSLEGLQKLHGDLAAM